MSSDWWRKRKQRRGVKDTKWQYEQIYTQDWPQLPSGKSWYWAPLPHSKEVPGSISSWWGPFHEWPLTIFPLQCLCGFPPGAPIFSTIKNRYHRLISNQCPWKTHWWRSASNPPGVARWPATVPHKAAGSNAGSEFHPHKVVRVNNNVPSFFSSIAMFNLRYLQWVEGLAATHAHTHECAPTHTHHWFSFSFFFFK